MPQTSKAAAAATKAAEQVKQEGGDSSSQLAAAAAALKEQAEQEKAARKEEKLAKKEAKVKKPAKKYARPERLVLVSPDGKKSLTVFLQQRAEDWKAHVQHRVKGGAKSRGGESLSFKGVEADARAHVEKLANLALSKGWELKAKSAEKMAEFDELPSAD